MPQLDTKMQVIVIENQDECETLWKMFSYESTLNENWLFRSLYAHYTDKHPKFFLVSHKNEPVGLLPLQYNGEEDILEFYGGNYMKENRFFHKSGYEYTFSIILKSITKPLLLDWMIPEMCKLLPSARCREYNYILDIEDISSFEDHLSTNFKLKTKSKILKQFIHIENSYNVSIVYNRYQDVETMFKINMQRFQEKSVLRHTSRQLFLQHLRDTFDVQLVSIDLDGVTQAVGYSILYNDTFYGINSGSNRDIPNLGKYMQKEKITQAINLGAKKIDAGRKSFGWKELFKYNPYALYTYSQNIPKEFET